MIFCHGSHDKHGKTKVKITDITNNFTTYIYLVVKDGIAVPSIKMGNYFTVALKSNGTVFSFGIGILQSKNIVFAAFDFFASSYRNLTRLPVRFSTLQAVSE